MNNQTSELKSRLRSPKAEALVTTAEQAASIIENGMVIGVSGFTPSGYPKVVPPAIAARGEAKHQAGEEFKLTLYTGASVGAEIDETWAKAKIIDKRLPYQTANEMRKQINAGEIEYIDMHLSLSTQYVNYGYLKPIDVAIVEAVAITEDGHIIPTIGIGNSATFIRQAEKVIVEINLKKSLALEGMADIYMTEKPPHRKPIPINHPGDRIGTTYIPCGFDKIAGIVITDNQDGTRALGEVDDDAKKISQNIIKFLENEVAEGRLTNSLLPLQSGVGSVANAVLYGLCESNFENLTCYTEVVQDSMLDLLRAGKASLVSTTSLSPSPDGLEKFEQEMDFFKDKIILRPQEISNNPEVARRIGVIAMNTAIEFDIYGNVNSTHIMGSRMMNGIGGSGDFARSAYLTIFSTSSIAKNGDISSVVPMVSHVDHTEHDVMVVVTEQGYADLRGLSPKERAVAIIENCAHPDYRDELRSYFERASENGPKHTPHILTEALSWHSSFVEHGSMKKFVSVIDK